MKTLKFIVFALSASVVMSASAEAKDQHKNGGSQGSRISAPGRGPGPRSAGVSRFNRGQAMPYRSFSAGGNPVFRQNYVNSYSRGALSPGRHFNGESNRDNRSARLQAGDHFGRTANSHIFNPTRFTGNRGQNHRNGINNHPADRFAGSDKRLNGTHGEGNRRDHVFERHSADWHRDWDHDRDHFWEGHRCRFVDGSWIIFDLGFVPWYGYSNEYYASNYYNAYNYDPDYSSYYPQGGYEYGNQNTDSTVAAAQEELARQGYYRRAEVDGVMGQETSRAIARFQRDRGLRVTGYLTPATLRSLGLA